jgi:hypothetical protein
MRGKPWRVWLGLHLALSAGCGGLVERDPPPVEGDGIGGTSTIGAGGSPISVGGAPVTTGGLGGMGAASGSILGGGGAGGFGSGGATPGGDNCPEIDNPDQQDTDHDGIGDACDAEIVDNADRLIVPSGTTLELYGPHCYTIEVRIAGTVVVPAAEDGAAELGGLTLQAPLIAVHEYGAIIADNAGFAGGLPSDAFETGGLVGSGPGSSCGGGPGSAVGQAGTGASYGGTGGLPTHSYPLCNQCSMAKSFHCVGAAGSVYGTASGDDVALGSGGGAAGNSLYCSGSGGHGGRGGGAIVLLGSVELSIDGLVSARGAEPDAADDTCGYRGGGGGGSGGTLVVVSPTLTGGGKLDVSGGRGGEALGLVTEGADYESWAWSGGGGGGGRLKVFSASDAFSGSRAADGGQGGLVPEALYGIVGEAGDDGTTTSTSIVPASFGAAQCG